MALTKCAFVFVVSTLIQLECRAQCEDYTCFYNFLSYKMDNYSEWLQANNMDPSPTVYDVTPLRLQHPNVNLDVNFRDLTLRGHSADITKVEITFNWLTLKFRTDFKITNNITFYASEYQANGTARALENSMVPVYAGGNWNITIQIIDIKSFEISLFVNITQNYTVVISSWRLENVLLSADGGYEMYFENLFEDEVTEGYRDLIQKSIFDEFGNYVGAAEELPLRTQYLEFWKDVFENVTFEDIADFTLPPPPVTEIATNHDS